MQFKIKNAHSVKKESVPPFQCHDETRALSFLIFSYPFPFRYFPPSRRVTGNTRNFAFFAYLSSRAAIVATVHLLMLMPMLMDG
ncbi:hypothetical protein K445DRAFT_151064 [Daldinia sp. EC12]|nr:hypothetical protein K445DRAFT_151064 [Daldinia sp. EC12]